MPNERITRLEDLPQWAQDRIYGLEHGRACLLRQVYDLQKGLNELKKATEDNGTR